MRFYRTTIFTCLAFFASLGSSLTSPTGRHTSHLNDDHDSDGHRIIFVSRTFSGTGRPTPALPLEKDIVSVSIDSSGYRFHLKEPENEDPRDNPRKVHADLPMIGRHSYARATEERKPFEVEHNEHVQPQEPVNRSLHLALRGNIGNGSKLSSSTVALETNASGLDRHVALPIQSAYFQLQLLSRVRSYLHETSSGMLVFIVLCSFMAGAAAARIFMPSGSNPDIATSRPNTLQSSDKGIFEQFEDLVQGSTETQAAPSASNEMTQEELLLSFDFETRDEQNQKTSRWQWCTAEQVQQLGLIMQAPTARFEDYKRVDTDLTSKGVKEVLLQSNVDPAVFDIKRDGQELLWKLLRREGYLMLLDEGLPSQKVLMMVETVRLRFVDGNKILVQKGDESYLAQGFCLPAKEKTCNESPMTTAKGMWHEILKMAPDIAHFVLDSIEDNEIVHYTGLRCVERTHIVDVELSAGFKVIKKSLNPLIKRTMNKVGLPDHTDFSSTDPLNEEVEMRSFTWMTKEQCKEACVFPQAQIQAKLAKPAEKTAGRSLFSAQTLEVEDTTATCDEQLKTFLQNAGVDIQSPVWQAVGRGRTLIQKLAKELSSDQCCITDTSSGLHRCVNVVALRLWSDSERKLMLVEKAHKYDSDDGEAPWVSQLQLPGSKKSVTENLKTVGMRIIEKNLNLSQEQVSFGDDYSFEYFEYTTESSRFEGIKTKYEKFFIDVELEDDDALFERLGLAIGL